MVEAESPKIVLFQLNLDAMEILFSSRVIVLLQTSIFGQTIFPYMIYLDERYSAYCFSAFALLLFMQSDRMVMYTRVYIYALGFILDHLNWISSCIILSQLTSPLRKDGI